jgi:hypothetical protein
VLLARAEREKVYLSEVRDLRATRVAVVSWRSQEPIGPNLLTQFVK